MEGSLSKRSGFDHTTPIDIDDILWTGFLCYVVHVYVKIFFSTSGKRFPF